MNKRFDGRDDPILEPDLPIVDAHHHLIDGPVLRYRLGDYRADIEAGLRVVASVYVETLAFARVDGPEPLPGDMHTAGVYDCFTGTLIMMLEDLGFCAKGEGGPFVADGQITYGGKIPVNTDGGLLSFAHPGMPGALFHFHEVIQQLRGGCGARQVPDATVGIVHTLGAGFATNATTILGTENAL